LKLKNRLGMHLHEGVFYQVIKIHAIGSKKSTLVVCEQCLREMWRAKAWAFPETKKILEDVMKELKIYDN